ncbi:MAG: hypothetical protein R3C56_38280 [Pirellulaceae bacterium]
MNSSLAVPREMSESCLASLECEIRRHLNFTLAHGEDVTKPRYLYRALAIAVRDRLIEQWRGTERRLQSEADKKVYYLSLEFLIGRSLSNAVYNLDLDDAARSAARLWGDARRDRRTRTRRWTGQWRSGAAWRLVSR